MKEEILELETVDELYELLRKNLQDSHLELFKTVGEIEKNEKPLFEVINDILNFSAITYHTLDAMLQIQLGILKSNQNLQSKQ